MKAVLERDFLAETGSVRSFRARTYMAVLVTTAVAVFLFSVQDLLRRSPDEASRYVFRVGVGALLVVASVMTPAAVVSSILGERQQQTLGLVLATPVGPVRFALAKLLARTGTIGFWTLSAIPPLSLCVLLGGVSGGDLLRTGALVVGTVLELSAWAVFTSARSSRLATAAVAAYLLPALRWGATGWLVWRWVEAEARRAMVFGVPDPSSIADALVLLSSTPLGGVLHLLRGDPRFILSMGPGGAPMALAPAPWGPFLEPAFWYLGVSASLSLALVLLAGLHLRRESEPPRSFLPRLPGLRRARRSRPPGNGNPVAWRERRMVNTGASRPLYYLTLLFLCAGAWRALAAFVPSDFDGPYGRAYWPYSGAADAEALRAFLVPSALLVAAVCAVAAAAAVGHERTQGTWDLLRVSPLTPRLLVLGKFRGVLQGAAFLAIPPTCVLVLAWWRDVAGPGSLLLVLGAAAVPVLLWTAVGLRIGIRVRRPGVAVMATLLLFLSSFAVTTAAGNVAQWVTSFVRVRGNPNLALRSASPWVALRHATASSLHLPVSEHRFWVRGGGPPGDWALLWTAAHLSLALTLLAGAPAAMERSLAREAEDGGGG